MYAIHRYIRHCKISCGQFTGIDYNPSYWIAGPNKVAGRWPNTSEEVETAVSSTYFVLLTVQLVSHPFLLPFHFNSNYKCKKQYCSLSITYNGEVKGSVKHYKVSLTVLPHACLHVIVSLRFLANNK